MFTDKPWAVGPLCSNKHSKTESRRLNTKVRREQNAVHTGLQGRPTMRATEAQLACDPDDSGLESRTKTLLPSINSTPSPGTDSDTGFTTFLIGGKRYRRGSHQTSSSKGSSLASSPCKLPEIASRCKSYSVNSLVSNGGLTKSQNQMRRSPSCPDLFRGDNLEEERQQRQRRQEDDDIEDEGTKPGMISTTAALRLPSLSTDGVNGSCETTVRSPKRASKTLQKLNKYNQINGYGGLERRGPVQNAILLPLGACDRPGHSNKSRKKMKESRRRNKRRHKKLSEVSVSGVANVCERTVRDRDVPEDPTEV